MLTLKRQRSARLRYDLAYECYEYGLQGLHTLLYCDHAQCYL